MASIHPTVRALGAALVVSLTGLHASGQEAGTTDEFERPKYSFLRQNEDWSGLRGRDRHDTGDWLDPIKFVPLNSDGSNWVSFGGHTWMRYENWNGFNFGAAPPGAVSDDQLLYWRLLLHADFHFGDHFRAYVEGKTALVTDRDLPGGKRPIDEDTGALQQAFADVVIGDREGTRFTLRPGRQMLLFGKQRLVSPLPWGNTLRTWDGVQGILQTGGWKVSGFVTRFVPVQQTEFNTPDQGNAFFGVYASNPGGGSGPDYDVYWLGIQNDDASFNGTAGDEKRHTFGARVGRKPGGGGLDYDVEAAYQLGSVGDGDISAWMLGAQLGYAPGGSLKPRFYLGVDYGSGDDGDGGDVGTFNQLYPLGHAYLGLIDTIGRQNIISPNLGVQVVPAQDWKLELAGHAFFAADTNDALYNAGGGAFRAGGSYESDQVGYELDFTANYQFDRHLAGLLGYSHFFAGDAIEESGPADDIDFFYVSLTYTF